MTAKINISQIPLVYAYLYMKIKRQMRGDRIAGSTVRKIIQKEILCEKNKGEKGIPRKYCYDIIKDIVELKLIKKVGKVGNDITYQNNNENVLETIERLKEWKISAKLREDKDVQAKLQSMLNILDKDTLYRVMKSKCDKQLQQAFW